MASLPTSFNSQFVFFVTPPSALKFFDVFGAGSFVVESYEVAAHSVKTSKIYSNPPDLVYQNFRFLIH